MLLIVFVSLVIFSLILLGSVAYSLYAKWRNSIFLHMASAAGAAAVPFIIILMLPGGRIVGLCLVGTGAALLHASVFHLFRPKLRKELRYYFAAASLLLLNSLLGGFLMGGGALAVAAVLTICLGTALILLLIPHMAVGRKYPVSVVIHILAMLLIGIYAFKRSTFVLDALIGLELVSLYVLFLTVFDRVVDMLGYISHTAYTDPLTGLFNRRYFEKQGAKYIAEGIPISVIFFDIDNFKKLNDTQGHDKGDEVLKAVARILQEESAGIGIAGRFGGEEMIVLLSSSSVQVSDVAEGIRGRVQTESIVTVSVGYGHMEDGLTITDLIKRADMAMYQAKTSGKNKVIGYSSIL